MPLSPCASRDILLPIAAEHVTFPAAKLSLPVSVADKRLATLGVCGCPHIVSLVSVRKEGKIKLFTNHFGIEIEFTGITRQKAANIAARYLSGQGRTLGDYYDTQCITAPDGRVWKFMYDGSIKCQRKEHGTIIPADKKHSVELVSPICLTEIWRKTSFLILLVDIWYSLTGACQLILLCILDGGSRSPLHRKAIVRAI